MVSWPKKFLCFKHIAIPMQSCLMHLSDGSYSHQFLHLHVHNMIQVHSSKCSMEHPLLQKEMYTKPTDIKYRLLINRYQETSSFYGAAIFNQCAANGSQVCRKSLGGKINLGGNVSPPPPAAWCVLPIILKMVCVDFLVLCMCVVRWNRLKISAVVVEVC